VTDGLRAISSTSSQSSSLTRTRATATSTRRLSSVRSTSSAARGLSSAASSRRSISGPVTTRSAICWRYAARRAAVGHVLGQRRVQHVVHDAVDRTAVHQLGGDALDEALSDRGAQRDVDEWALVRRCA
jgi:hypothetical protein